MSIRALLKGVERRLRSEGVLDDQPDQTVGRLCGVHDGARPPNNAGQFYFAIDWAGGRGNDPDPQRHDVYHAVLVTLTARLNYAPRDRRGAVMTNLNDVYDLADLVTGPNVVHGNWDLIRYANELIVGTQAWADLDPGNRTATVNGFTEPLVLAGSYGPARPAQTGWLGLETPKDVYVIEMRFERARRIQYNTTS